jgi:hydroxymethylpyrimidine pyrophosphatase-like HAD family hydrolase
MSLPIKIISTDFDGTLFAEFERPPIPLHLAAMIADLQGQGVKWVINTGREMASLMESLARARLPVQPDYLVLVEREIYLRAGARFVPVESWNGACERHHADLFARVRPQVPELMDWVNRNFRATVYADAWSPFCLIAQTNGDADLIQEGLDNFCTRFPELVVVRNNVYARFSHTGYNKGTALGEIARLVGANPEQVCVAGDHLNDLPMLRTEVAKYLIAPANAFPAARDLVLQQGGFLSRKSCGDGVAEGLIHYFGAWINKTNLHGAENHSRLNLSARVSS